MPSDRLELRAEILECEGCDLNERCTSPVPFHGPTPAPVAVLGEAPGEQEDAQGQPFVGPAGELARRHLKMVGLDPDELAWFNVCSCWPRGTPTADQITACAGNRESQLALIRPDFLVAFGRTALQALRPDLDIKRGRGRPFLHGDTVAWGVYHPAAILRNRLLVHSFHEDLEAFADMVAGGRETWWKFAPDRCASCPDFVALFDETGIGWCERHRPQEQTAVSEPAPIDQKTLF